MNKCLLLTIVSLLAGVAIAAGPVRAKKPLTPAQKAARAERAREAYEYFGGKIRDVRNQKGKIVLVNCQKSAAVAWMNAVATQLADGLRVVVTVTDGSFDLKNPTLQGEASIFIVDDPSLPISLVATESRWALVNVAKLKSEKAKFFEMRVRKAIARTCAILCGGAGSRFDFALTECILTPVDYDRHINDTLPFDVKQRMTPYLEALGVTRFEMSDYRSACQEGWAPQPTNAVQKAIWDEIHAAPTAPIVIKPEPAKKK